VSTAETRHPVWCSPEHCSVTDDGTHGVQPQAAPPEVAAGTCRACGLDWVCTVIGVLPTPQLRTGAFLAVLRAEVATRSGKDPPP
jgi:hypothetical protein